MGGQHHAPAALLPGKDPVTLYRRLDVPQGRSGQVRKILPPPRFDPRNVQSVASPYTGWAMPALQFILTTKTSYAISNVTLLRDRLAIVALAMQQCILCVLK